MQQIPLPYLLTQIPDPPKTGKLYIRGNFPNPEHYKFLTVIGSRKYSTYGKQVCEHIMRELVGYPIVIVSGLALGIDSIAHQTALENNLLTVAVPGSGLHDRVLYPASNRGLAERILKNGGCLVSEFEPDFKATTWSFPQRNRIMAGLSDALLVIEAENISGTRITARLATEYNREVFSIPGSILSPTSGGTNELIKEGATPLTSAQDIIEFFGFKQGKQKKLQFLSEDEEKIIKLLIEPQSRNEIAQQTGMSIIKLNILLSSMEIKGLLKEAMGKIYRC